MASGLAPLKSYAIFISYRQADAKDTALSLYALLTNRFKLRVFLDVQELDSLHDLAQLVTKSKAVIPIISPGYLETLRDPQSWCSLEIKTALANKIPLVPVFDPEKTSIPPASFVASLAPDLQPLFKILFKPIRREGEYLDIFLKEVLRGCGQEDAWIRATADPWASLDCTPRTRFMLQASAVRFAVASAIIKQLGLADIEEFRHADDSMVDSLGLKPLEAAKVKELIFRIKQGEWSHITDSGVLRGLYTTAESLAPEGASDESPGSGRSWPAMSGGGLSSESVRSRATTLMTGAGVGGVSYKSLGGSTLGGRSGSPSVVYGAGGGGPGSSMLRSHLSTRSDRSSPSHQDRLSSVRGSPLRHAAQRPATAGASSQGGSGVTAVVAPRSGTISCTGGMSGGSKLGDHEGGSPHTCPSDTTNVETLGIVRVTSGDLADLAKQLRECAGASAGNKATTFDLANRTFVASTKSLGDMRIEASGITVMGGTILLGPGQRIMITGTDVLLEDLTITAGSSHKAHQSSKRQAADAASLGSESEDDDDEDSSSESSEANSSSEEDEGSEEESEDDEEEEGEEGEEEEEEEEDGSEDGDAGGMTAALEVCKAAAVTLRRVTLQGGGALQTALLVHEGASVTALDTMASNMGKSAGAYGHAAVVSGQGTLLHAEECHWGQTQGAVVLVQQGGMARLFGCAVSGSAKRGCVQVQHTGSILAADTTEFSHSRDAVIAAREGGAVELEACSVSQSATSSGVIVLGRGSRLAAHNTSLQNNEQMGVYVTDGASAVVTACRFTGNRLHSAEAEGPGSSLQHDLRCTYSPRAQLPVASKGGSVVSLD